MRVIGLAALLMLIICVCAGPLVWLVVTSAKSGEELTSLPPLLPSHPGLGNYRSVISSAAFSRVALNSFSVALAATFLSLLIGAFGAFALARLEVPGRGVLLALILSASMLPPVAIISPLFLVIRALHLRDSILALVLLDTTFSLPLSILLLESFFRKVPAELFNAALIDGCSVTGAFLRLVLPLSAPGLGAGAILVFLFAWNEFLFALTFTVTEVSRTLPVAIVMFPGQYEVPWGEISAAAV